MAAYLADGIVALAVIAALVVAIIALLLWSQRALWSVYAVVAAISPMPISLPAPPAQMLTLANVVTGVRSTGRVMREFIPLNLLLLALWFTVALMWSPHPNTGLPVILIAFSLVATIAFASRSQEGDDRDLLRWTMILTAPIAIAQSLATIIFRISPDVEAEYFRSEVFYFLLGGAGRNLYTTMQNNVTDPDKAGGILFVNGNRASMVMAVWGLVYLALWIRRRNPLFFVLALACMSGAIMTGSKTAIVLAFSIPVAFLILPLLVRARRSPALLAFGVLATTGAIVTLTWLAGTIPDTLTGADTSSRDRANLWTAGMSYIEQSPFLGLGFGGWFDRWADDAAQYGMVPTLPPHNVALSIWSNAGVLALLFATLAVGGIFVGYLRLIAKAASPAAATATSLELGALSWMIAHAMFDNTDIFGVYNTIPVFAIIAARATASLAERKRTLTEALPAPKSFANLQVG